jgi:hypothetical protein
MRFRAPRLTPSLVVSFAALFIALGGTGLAAQAFLTKQSASKLIKHLAGGLSVKHAKTAHTADFATNAGSANSATNATDAINATTATNATELGGQPASAYEPSGKIVTSGGEKFLSLGQVNVTIATIGHFTFTASCTNVSGTQVEFNVVSNVEADLDSNGPEAPGTVQNIHTDSDALAMPTPLAPGAFEQVGSASSSTEIAVDGQEVDVFYNDGVNWPASGGQPAHDCFAGVTGFEG